jgi:phosphate acyltransferase
LINIALDAMGGDCGSKTNIAGAILAVKEYPIEVTLVGDSELIQKELSHYSKSESSKLHIQHASEVIEMAESPSKAFRTKKDSSIHVGLGLVRDNKADGFVSAGNTGAVLASSTFILGRSKDIERPGLAAVFPSKTKPFVILDLGSNVDCKPQQLVEFAIMGNFFAQVILERENPRIGLLSIGEEKDKGNALTQATYPLLEELPFNFIGNIEAKEMTLGRADVVVCDGFVGNNLLKFGEGISKLFSGFFKEEAKRSLLSKFALLLLKPAFKRFKKKFDYDEYGGAHLLGVKGVSIVAHGSANSIAIKNAIKTAYLNINSKLTEKIASAVSEQKHLMTQK